MVLFKEVKNLKGFLQVLSSSIVSFLLLAMVAYGATTIGTNIVSGGSLTISGASIFNEDSAAVDFRVESDNQANMLFVDGTNDRVGIASTTPFVALGVTGTTTSSAGAILGLNGSNINQVRFGSCTYNPAVSIAASSTLSTNCTSATGVTTVDKVFVTPVSLEKGMVMTSASSTAADVIQVSVLNSGLGTVYGGAVTPASASWFWLAIR